MGIPEFQERHPFIRAELGLRSSIQKFLDSPDEVWDLDRHVMSVFTRPQSSEDPRILKGCERGLASLTCWEHIRKSEEFKPVITSKPYLIIDDEWLAGIDDPPPPHVCIVLSKIKDFKSGPILNEAHEVIEPIDQPLIASWHRHYLIKRYDPAPHEDYGCWLIQLRET